MRAQFLPTRLLAATAAVVLACVYFAPAALADCTPSYTHVHCPNVMTYPNTYCSTGVNHSYSSASGLYNGSGVFTVCAKMVGVNSGTTYKYACNTSTNYAIAYNNNHCSSQSIAYSWHGDNNRHTLYGNATY